MQGVLLSLLLLNNGGVITKLLSSGDYFLGSLSKLCSRCDRRADGLVTEDGSSVRVSSHSHMTRGVTSSVI